MTAFDAIALAWRGFLQLDMQADDLLAALRLSEVVASL